MKKEEEEQTKTGKAGNRKSNYDSDRSQAEFGPPKTDDTVQIEDQIKTFIKKQVDSIPSLIDAIKPLINSLRQTISESIFVFYSSSV